MEIEKQIGSAQGVNYRSAQGVNYRQPFAKTGIAGILGFRADLVVYTVCTAYRYTEALPPTLPPGASTDQILVQTPSKSLRSQNGEFFAVAPSAQHPRHQCSEGPPLGGPGEVGFDILKFLRSPSSSLRAEHLEQNADV